MREGSRQILRIHSVKIWINVDQNGRCPCHLDCGNGCYRGVRYGSKHVATANTETAKRERQSICAVTATDGETGTEPSCKLRLECLAGVT